LPAIHSQGYPSEESRELRPSGSRDSSERSFYGTRLSIVQKYAYLKFVRNYSFVSRDIRESKAKGSATTTASHASSTDASSLERRRKSTLSPCH